MAQVVNPIYDTVFKYLMQDEKVAKVLIGNILKTKVVKNRQIGIISLSNELSIDEVTEIFIRINSQGTKLNQADFAMSRMAANEKYGGNTLRKAVEYFSHLAVAPNWYSEMAKDHAFMSTPFAAQMFWLKNDNDSIYDPEFNDILRTSFMYKFNRAKMKDLVALLEGRNFETRENEESISEETFNNLSEGVLEYMGKHNFQNFVLALKSAGFVHPKLINSQMTLDFAYTLFLLLHNDPTIQKTDIKHYVQKWYVLSTLTSRYISSPETAMDYDIKRINEKGFVNYLAEIEPAELSDTFWNTQLPQRLESASVTSPFLNVFFAAQIYFGDNALFSNGTKIGDLLVVLGDVHHIFPRKYLIKQGITEKNKYNQIANFTYLDTVINKNISDDAPNVYFQKAFDACKSSQTLFGGISDAEKLSENLLVNCIPPEIVNMQAVDYEVFLTKRRKLMAEKIKKYYFSL